MELKKILEDNKLKREGGIKNPTLVREVGDEILEGIDLSLEVVVSAYLDRPSIIMTIPFKAMKGVDEVPLDDLKNYLSSKLPEDLEDKIELSIDTDNEWLRVDLNTEEYVTKMGPKTSGDGSEP